jgi:hypothetical protein
VTRALRPVTGTTGATRPGSVVLQAEPPGRRPLRLRAVVAVLSVVSLWVLWRTGPGKVPFVELFEQYARDWPSTQTPPRDAYVLRNFLGPLLYQAFPTPGTGRFLQLHLVALLAAGALLAAWLLRRLGSRSGPVAIVLVLLSPLTALLVLWIGDYDAFSALVWVVVLISLRHRPWVQALAGLLAGGQNLEQVLVGLVLLALVPELPRAVGLRAHTGWLIGGAVLGRVLTEIYLRSEGATVGSRLTFLSDPVQLENITKTFVVMAPIVLWTVLGGLWGFALTAVQDRWSDWSRSLQVRLAAVLVLALGFSFLAADHSRVIAMITFPLVVLGCMALAQRLGDLRALAGRWEAWLLLLAPPVMVQDDQLLRIGVKLGTWGIGPF